MKPRDDLITQIADQIASLRFDHPCRVGLDGRAASGKTSFGRDLAAAIRDRGRSATTISLDDFHNPSAVRHSSGRNSAIGYFEGAFDIEAIITRLLVPLGPTGSLEYSPKSLDLSTDTPLASGTVLSSKGEIFIIDGMFIHRPELIDYWDATILLRSSRAAAIRRGRSRDAIKYGGEIVAADLHAARYQTAFDLYDLLYRPEDAASIVIDHEEPGSPSLIRMEARPPRHAT